MKSRNHQITVVSAKMLIVTLSALLVTGCTSAPSQNEIKKPIVKIGPRLHIKWEKISNPSFSLEFTEAGHLTITGADNKYYTHYFFHEEYRLCIGVENFEVSDYPRVARDNRGNENLIWFTQSFSAEILPSGELFMSNFDGPYKDEAIIKEITGKYAPHQPRETSATQAPASIETRLAGIRAKDEIITSQLTKLEQDRNKLADRLRSIGIKSSADLQRLPYTKPLANELVELIQQISSAQKRHADYSALIVQLKSTQRRFERREGLAQAELSAADSQAISAILTEVDEKLVSLDDEIIRDLNTEDVLDKELERKPK